MNDRRENKSKILAIALGIALIFAVWHNFANSSKEHMYALEAISGSGVWNAGVDEENTQKIKLRKQSNDEEKEIIVEDSLLLAAGVEELYWFGDNILAVVSHVNPSLSCLTVYDIDTLELIEERYGVDFQWAGNEYTSFYYISPSPHFSEEIGVESIMNYEGDIVYKTSGNESLSGLAVSPKGNKFGFFGERFSDSKENVSLYIIDTITDTEKGNAKSASPPVKINWNEETGDLHWIDESILRVSSPSYEILLNADNGCVLSETRFGDNGKSDHSSLFNLFLTNI
ncbi:MAG: hypothetical protein K2N90_12180 [Lachnospiraceae bacterium]|nr:hypothetical protein [Lachnospiraceae bacterium]